MSPQIQTPLRRKHASCSRTVGPDLSIDKRAYLIIYYGDDRIFRAYFLLAPMLHYVKCKMYATSNHAIAHGSYIVHFVL